MATAKEAWQKIKDLIDTSILQARRDLSSSFEVMFQARFNTFEADLTSIEHLNESLSKEVAALRAEVIDLRGQVQLLRDSLADSDAATAIARSFSDRITRLEEGMRLQGIEFQSDYVDIANQFRAATIKANYYKQYDRRGKRLPNKTQRLLEDQDLIELIKQAEQVDDDILS